MSYKFLPLLLVILTLGACNSSDKSSSPQGKVDQQLNTPELASGNNNTSAITDEQTGGVAADNGGTGEK